MISVPRSPDLQVFFGVTGVCRQLKVRTSSRHKTGERGLNSVAGSVFSPHLQSPVHSHTPYFSWNKMTTLSHYAAPSLGIIYQAELGRLHGPSVCTPLNISVSSPGLNTSFDQLSQAWKQTPVATNTPCSRLYNDHENCMRTPPPLHHHHPPANKHAGTSH